MCSDASNVCLTNASNSGRSCLDLESQSERPESWQRNAPRQWVHPSWRSRGGRTLGWGFVIIFISHVVGGTKWYRHFVKGVVSLLIIFTAGTGGKGLEGEVQCTSNEKMMFCFWRLSWNEKFEKRLKQFEFFWEKWFLKFSFELILKNLSFSSLSSWLILGAILRETNFKLNLGKCWCLCSPSLT